jgi:PhzF family phenazine biosynthesis protein
MTEYRIVQVDAFAAAPFSGNPAAVMPLPAWPDDALMQAIAAENNLSETAFFIPDPDGAADYELRWFTPTTEVELCGHATLASGHVVLTDQPERDLVSFRTRQAGILLVNRERDGYAMALPAWAPQPAIMPDLVRLMGGAPVETLSAEGRYCLFIYPDQAAVEALTPDFAGLKAAGHTLYIASAPGDARDVYVRVFAPADGIDEDPVTGSAFTVLTPYWCDRLRREAFSATQGSARRGDLTARLSGSQVVLGGQAVTVIEGLMRLPD